MRRPRSSVTWSGRAAAPISRAPVAAVPRRRLSAAFVIAESLAALQDRYKRRRPIRSRVRVAASHAETRTGRRTQGAAFTDGT